MIPIVCANHFHILVYRHNSHRETCKRGINFNVLTVPLRFPSVSVDSFRFVLQPLRLPPSLISQKSLKEKKRREENA
jgi:hypothetical protein